MIREEIVSTWVRSLGFPFRTLPAPKMKGEQAAAGNGSEGWWGNRREDDKSNLFVLVKEGNRVPGSIAFRNPFVSLVIDFVAATSIAKCRLNKCCCAELWAQELKFFSLFPANTLEHFHRIDNSIWEHTCRLDLLIYCLLHSSTLEGLPYQPK